MAHELNMSDQSNYPLQDGWNMYPWNDQQAFAPTQQPSTQNADDFDTLFQPPSISQEFEAFLATDDATQTISEREEIGIKGEG